MLARRVSLAALLALAAASCGPAPQPVQPPPGPAGSSPLPVGSAPPPMPDDAPNVVRCGVDDRPRPVGELRRGLSAEERGLFGDRAPPEVFQGGARAPRRRPPQLPQPPVGADLPVRLEQGVAKIGPTPVPGLTQGLAGAAGPEACEPLVAEPDAGPFELEVELASTAEPLRVRSSRLGVPSPYVRCLMERACQLRASPEGASQRVRLPLRVVVGDQARLPPTGEPPSQTPPQPPSPALRVEVSSIRPEIDRVSAMVEAAVQRAGTSCLRGGEPTDAPILVRVTLAPGRRSSLDPREEREDERLGERLDERLAERFDETASSRAKRMPTFRDTLQITQVANEGQVPQGLMPFMGCVAGQLSGATIGRVPPDEARGRVERVRLRVVRNAPLPGWFHQEPPQGEAPSG